VAGASAYIVCKVPFSAKWDAYRVDYVVDGVAESRFFGRSSDGFGYIGVRSANVKITRVETHGLRRSMMDRLQGKPPTLKLVAQIQ